MPSKTIEDFAYQVRDYMRGAEVVEGKNHAYSQENNAVIATIENGKSYKVRWTGSATVTLKKNSASGTEVTSGSTSPLSFTADSDFDLYFGSSADVTEIMVYDGNDTSDTYEPYYVPVKDSKLSIKDQQVLGAWNQLKYPYYDTTKSNSGLDYTDLGDGRVEADGTSTVSNNDFTCFSRGIMNYELKAGTYYVSGCPEGGSESTYHLRISKNKVYNNPSQGFDDLGIDTGDGFSFTLTEKSQLGVAIRIGQTSINHLIFKPMISLKPNQPYVPYAMTNREITDNLTEVKGEGTLNTTYITGGHVYWYKIGKFVFVNFDGVVVGTSMPDGSTVVSDLPVSENLMRFWLPTGTDTTTTFRQSTLTANDTVLRLSGGGANLGTGTVHTSFMYLTK